MPVHSKPYAGRARNAPPLLGPKPYQKPQQHGPHSAWVTPGSPVTRNFNNEPTNNGPTHIESNGPLSNESKNDGPINNNESYRGSSVQFSVLRRPAEKKTDKVPKSPQVVRFGAAEIFGSEKYEDDSACSRQPEEEVNSSAIATKQTTKQPISPSLSGAQALQECEVSKLKVHWSIMKGM
jgi:hypothetical protein